MLVANIVIETRPMLCDVSCIFTCLRYAL